MWLLPIAEFDTAAPMQLKHATPVSSWQLSYDGKLVYFLAPDEFDKSKVERVEKKFDVRIRNEETPVQQLWVADLEIRQEKRLTSKPDLTISSVVLSQDGKWLGFRGTPAERYLRTVTESDLYGDLYLMETSTGKIERLTENKEAAEREFTFSRDGSLIAFTAPNDFEYFRDERIYVRPTAGGEWRKLGGDSDGPLSIEFWSEDGKKIFFNQGRGVTNQLAAVEVASGKVTPLTNERASLNVARDEDSGTVLITYTDPATPPDLFTVSSVDFIGSRSAWKQLTDSNPKFDAVALGGAEAIQWKSADGETVEGVLTKPVGYEKGQRYPLIVQIHGGPASADVLRLGASTVYYSQVYAGAGYIVLQPNYRGSANYGEKFRTQTAGDYFRQGYEDIMAGVDHLVATGIADPERMGVMGWSAGGHYSNWILTHTDRFKAISSGAGAMNWISMYAQNDVQRVREHYFGGTPYDRFDHYWDVSPLKYVKNAKTPTLIHVVDGDPRVPRPQSEELHMALKKLGVPTEMFVYPGTTHGITEPRNQLVKMMAEFHWFEKWIRGKPVWFEWKDVLATLPPDKSEAEKQEAEKQSETQPSTK